MSPRDSWIIGQGVESGSEYMTRLDRPRCIVRIFDAVSMEPEADPHPQDDDAGQGIETPAGEYLCIVHWLDPRPDDGAAIERILVDAADANEQFTRESMEEFDDDQ